MSLSQHVKNNTVNELVRLKHGSKGTQHWL